MSGEKVRDLFETTIPQELARRPSLGEGLRCRFHVAEAGAWEIDLRRSPCCIDARAAMGGYHAVVYVSAEDFWGLVQSAGANLDELVVTGRLRTTGDTARALEMTEIVAKGPPFVWPSSLRVAPVHAAFFGASEGDVVQAFPGWRNEASTFAPLAPPFPFVFAPVSSEWWDYLLDFHVTLVPDDREALEIRADDSLELWEKTDRVFPPLFAGRGGTSNVYATPRRLAPALAQLSDEEANALAAKLATELYPHTSQPNPFTGVEQDYSKYRDAFERNARRSLHDARELARNLRSPEALWFWGWFE